MQPARLVPIAIAAVLVIASCSGDDDATTAESTSPTTAPSGAAAQPPTATAAPQAAGSDDDASAMWYVQDVAIGVSDVWRGADSDGLLESWRMLPGEPLVAVADNSDGHVAFVSDDLVNYLPVHRGCCGVTLTDRVGDRVLIVSTSPDATNAFVSVDGGRTWGSFPVELPPVGADNPAVVTGVALTDDGYLAIGAPAFPSATLPVLAYRSTDLVDWTPIELDGLGSELPEASDLRIERGQNTLWIIAAAAQDSSAPALTPFRSTDGGRTFGPMPSLPVRSLAIAPVGARLVVWPSGRFGAALDHTGPWLLEPDAGWVQTPLRPDRWGETDVVLLSTALDHDTGRAFVHVERAESESGDPCTSLADECEAETALLTSDDGLAWRAVDAPTWNPPPAFGPTGEYPAFTPVDSEGWLIWQPESGSSATAHIWTGPVPVPTRDTE